MRTSTTDWYLLHTKPRQEVVAEQGLARLGVETFFPRLREDRVIRRCRQTVTGPLFPGYLFARFDFETRWRAVHFAHGVSRIVLFGDEPAMVADHVVTGIQQRMEDGAVVVRPRFRPGDKVRVAWGPFEGLEAIFEKHLTDQQRVVLLFQSLSFQARIVVDLDQVVNM
jgi:transcriptional antiterminator RfaH